MESLDQYLEYDLEPPMSQPKLREAFLRNRQERHASDKEDRKERLDRVAELWARRVEWWEVDYRPRWHVLPHQNK